ncbi:hypothetical protein A7982_13500 [Minicystis rosea]|nr:hypothetical protein A7982_13500 [Minicystis rosea]
MEQARDREEAFASSPRRTSLSWAIALPALAGAACVSLSARMLRELGPVLRPKVVVLFFYEGNDLRDLNREKASSLARYLDPAYTQDLFARREAIDRALAAYGDAQMERLDGLAFRMGQIPSLKRVRALAGFASPPLVGEAVTRFLVANVRDGDAPPWTRVAR